MKNRSAKANPPQDVRGERPEAALADTAAPYRRPGYGVGRVPLLAIFLVIPCWIVWRAFVLRQAAGPFWLGHNADPEYMYLFNALSVALWEQVGHADHPGSTLQWLGAAVIRIAHAVVGQKALVVDVLRYPEFYLHVIHGVIIIILGVVTGLSGFIILRQTRNLIPAVLFQAVPLISLTLRNALQRVSPEPLLVGLSILLALGVFLIITKRREQRGYGPLITVGVVSGLAIALKITVLPLLILPLIVLSGFWRRLMYLLISLVTFLALTVNPLMDLGRLFLFTGDLVSRKGYNRPFDADAGHLEAMVGGFAALGRQLWAGEHATMLFVSISLLLTAVLWWACDRGRTACRAMLKGLWAINVVFIAQVLLVANAPDARIRYLMPALPLLGLEATLLWGVLRHGPVGWARWLSPCLKVAMLLVVLLCFPGLWHERSNVVRSRQQWTEARWFIRQQKLDAYPVINYYRASDPRHALYLGEVFTRYSFGPWLRQMYPEYYQLGRWTYRLDQNFREKEISIEDILKDHETVLVHGQSNAQIFLPSRQPGSHEIEPVFDNGVERVFIVRRVGPQ